MKSEKPWIGSVELDSETAEQLADVWARLIALGVLDRKAPISAALPHVVAVGCQAVAAVTNCGDLAARLEQQYRRKRPQILGAPVDPV